APVLAHVPDLVLHREPDPGQVGRHHRRPVGLLDLREGADRAEGAGVVERDVEAAMARPRRVDEAGDIGRPRPVRDAGDPPARRPLRRPPAAGRGTPATTASPRPPASTIRPTVSASGSGRRPATTTVAPARANASAVALPIPVPPPVTRTTFPE